MKKSAVMSEDGHYRFWLGRAWDESLPTITWIMANPSTADAEKDDPTLKRIIKFSQSWGFGRLIVVNLFPFRSSRPAECLKWFKIEKSSDGSMLQVNRIYLARATERSQKILLAWGAAGEWHPGYTRVIVQALRDKAYCLATTKSGQPMHPLARGRNRIADDRLPIPIDNVRPRILQC